ncbi:MAG: hypothetical protein J6Y21_04995 [Clostridia bacterium]|nr:hypothetical protein [Clostridia bacterium]
MFIRRLLEKVEKGIRTGRIAAALAAILCAVTFLIAELPAHEARYESTGAAETIVLAGLPSKYETPGRTPVLNQKDNPLCWAYSTVDMLNINAVKQGIAPAGTSLYSAPMFARAVYTGKEHKIVTNPSLWYRYAGSPSQALMMSSVGKGLMKNERYPTIDSASAVSGDAIYDSDGLISEFRMFDIWEDPNQKVSKIKEWVYNFGAVGVSLFMGKYDSVRKLASTDKWDNTKAAHSVLIVGWDDSKSTDSGTGAFLVKNTWGASWGDGGYAYVSYRADMGRDIYAAKVEPAYGLKVLTHTEIMPQGAAVYDVSEPASAVNVFTVSEAMTVKSAKAYIDDAGTLEVNVWVRPSGIDDALLSRTPDAKATLSVSEPGFYTLKLSRDLALNAGDKIAAQFFSKTQRGYKLHNEYIEIYPPDWETVCGPNESYRVNSNGITESSSNFVGALVGTLKNPPKTEAPATSTPTPSPKPAATQTPTPKPTATPTAEPTAAPTLIPTVAPTVQPTAIDIFTPSNVDTTADQEVATDNAGSPGNDNSGDDPAANLGGLLKKLGRILLIGAAVIVVGLVLIIALARAGKNKK